MFLVYPYTDLYNLNLDWMIKAIKEVQEVIENLGSVVNTFNEREGNVVLTSEDVNSLEIDSVVTLPEGSFDSITEAQKTAYYEAGKRIIVALNTYGDYSRLGFLYKAGAAVGMAEYVPTQEEYAVLSFNGRTGQVTLTDTDVNNLQIQPVLQLNGVDVSSLSMAQKLQYFDAGIRFIHCVPTQGGTLNTQKLYTLSVNESGGTRIPITVIYDPLQGQGLVKAVNSESPNNAGQVYLYADDIDMANDDDDTVYERITDLESAAVKSVNGITPTQGAVVVTGSSIQVASDDDTTIDDFAVDVYSELDDRVKSVNGVSPTSGAVTLTGADIAVSASDATKIDAALDLYEKKIIDNIAYIHGVYTVETDSIYTGDTLPVLKNLFNALLLVEPDKTKIVNIIVNSPNTSRHKLVYGYIAFNKNFGCFIYHDPQLKVNPFYARFTAMTSPNPSTTGYKMVLGNDIAVDVDNTAPKTALSKYTFVLNRDGLYRLNQDVPADTNITTQNATFLSSETVGGFMNYAGLKPNSSIGIDDLFSNHPYITAVSNAYSFKIGQATILTAIITVSDWPANAQTALATIASEYRSTTAIRGFMYSWERDTFTGRAVRINWDTSGNLICYDVGYTDITIDTTTGRKFLFNIVII